MSRGRTLTSDSRRVGRAATIALAAAVGSGVGLGVLAARGEIEEKRSLAPPHVRAKVACASCHVDEPVDAKASSASSAPSPKVTCAPCHTKDLHGSTRGPHGRLMAEGKLTCATCHPAHEGFQALAFGEGGVTRWGKDASVRVPLTGAVLPIGQTVPLVRLSTCGTCHTLLDPRDPAARCVPPVDARGPTWSTTPSLCFDEHAVALEKTSHRAKIGVCGGQHSDAHLAATELSAELARKSPWQETKVAGRGFVLPPFFAFLLAGLAAIGLALGDRRTRARERAAPKVRLPVANERKKLPTIDATSCLGCNACVEACPFDVLEVEAYVAKVARPDECCGVVLCAQVCPNGSLTIREGEVVEQRIALDEELESLEVTGIYVVGDLTGVPLIKNAISQGDRAVRRIHATLRRSPGPAPDVDVLVVGGGPAGLSAALRAKALGLSCVVLEQGTVAASIKSFPRGKIVHDSPLSLPVEGDLWLAQATKEELVAQWERIVRARGLDVREGQRVVNAARDGAHDFFRVEALGPDGTTVLSARRMVLAIGRRGTPKTLPITIDDGADEKVHYALADAAWFARKRVVVVGLGDTAMEAALAIARQPGARVTIVARGETFSRGKAKNVREMKRAIADGRIAVRFGARLTGVGKTSARVEAAAKGTTEALANDAVLILIGGVPSWDLLEKMGVSRVRDSPVGA